MYVQKIGYSSDFQKNINNLRLNCQISLYRHLHNMDNKYYFPKRGTYRIPANPRPFHGKIICTSTCNMALKQQQMTDAKTVMCKDFEKLVQKLHASLIFTTFPSTWVSESLVEGNAMERNHKKMGSLFEAFSRAEEKIHEKEN